MTPEPEVQQPKRVSIVIVSLNRSDTLRRSLTELGDQHQVLVVDNGSRDGLQGFEEEFPSGRFIRLPKNFGLIKATNIGVRAAEGEYILVLHDDAIISGDSVAKLADYLATHQDAAAVSPFLLTPSGSPAPQVCDIPTPSQSEPVLRAPDAGEEIAVPCVSGAALLFRTSFLRALRHIDERYGNYGSAIELCMQVRRANKKTVILRDVTAIHEQNPSPMNKAALSGDRVAGTAVFLGKHHGFMAGMLYRVKSALASLFTFRLKVLAGALTGAKIDGTS